MRPTPFGLALTPLTFVRRPYGGPYMLMALSLVVFGRLGDVVMMLSARVQCGGKRETV